MNNNINIVDYRPEHQPAFERLNREWITENFELEPLDLFVLQQPEEALLKPGGAILVALSGNEVAGVLALRRINDYTLEYTKMAVDRKFRRQGIGEALSHASFAKAKELGAKKIILYSNTLQAAAIKLYEKLGFRHLQVEQGVYKRANVKMEMDVSNDSMDKTHHIKIRSANADDAATIAAIGIRAFHDAFVHLFNSPVDLANYLSYTYDVKKIRNSILRENNAYFLATVDDVPAGFAKMKKFSLNPHLKEVSQSELQKIYVLSSFHGSGVGKLLIDTVIQLAKELQPDLLWLDVHISNIRAIRFYEKNDFHVMAKHFFNIGSQTFEYHVMVLPISSSTKSLRSNYTTQTKQK